MQLLAELDGVAEFYDKYLADLRGRRGDKEGLVEKWERGKWVSVGLVMSEEECSSLQSARPSCCDSPSIWGFYLFCVGREKGSSEGEQITTSIAGIPFSHARATIKAAIYSKICY